MRIKIASIALFALMLVGQNAFAQTPQQIQSKVRANNAVTSCSASKSAADGLKSDALTEKALVPPTYAGWTQAQKITYEQMISGGDSFLQTGGVFYSLGEYYRVNGNTSYVAGNTQWDGGFYVSAASLYDSATSSYTSAFSSYGQAGSAYQSAFNAYQAAVTFYWNNVPPPG